MRVTKGWPGWVNLRGVGLGDFGVVQVVADTIDGCRSEALDAAPVPPSRR